jgi:hypothetical protein
MTEPESEQGEPLRRRYEAGLPDHHDPLGGIGGAPPACSALTLRLVLACFGFIFCVGAAIAAALARLTVLTVVMVMGAVVAVVDVAVIIRRKHRGEPG